MVCFAICLLSGDTCCVICFVIGVLDLRASLLACDLLFLWDLFLFV